MVRRHYLNNLATNICYNDIFQSPVITRLTLNSTREHMLRELSAAIDFLLLEIPFNTDSKIEELINVLGIIKKSRYSFVRTLTSSEPVYNEQLKANLKLKIQFNEEKSKIRVRIYVSHVPQKYIVIFRERQVPTPYMNLKRLAIYIEDIYEKII